MVPCLEGRLGIDGGSLECACIPGRLLAPTLVLLHEGLGCVELWRDFPSRLSEVTGCPVFLWSRAGYGHSTARPLPWPLDYMQREGRALPRLLDAAGIAECVLIGHSDGASIALVAGGLGDPRIKGIVVMAPHVFVEPEGLASIAQAREAFRRGTLRAKLARYHAEVDCAFCGWCDSWLAPDFKGWSIERFLPSITSPVLQIQGEDDQYGTGAQLEAIARQAGAVVDTHVLKACRHAPHHEQPEVTLGLIRDFLQRLPP